jgi:hypothetical protein
MPETARQQKITFGEMRESGVYRILIYCAGYKCSHSIEMSAGRWPDHVRLSDIEPLFVCKACGKRGADLKPGMMAWDGLGRHPNLRLTGSLPGMRCLPVKPIQISSVKEYSLHSDPIRQPGGSCMTRSKLKMIVSSAQSS